MVLGPSFCGYGIKFEEYSMLLLHVDVKPPGRSPGFALSAD
jgi:hypothetical protein